MDSHVEWTFFYCCNKLLQKGVDCGCPPPRCRSNLRHRKRAPSVRELHRQSPTRRAQQRFRTPLQEGVFQYATALIGECYSQGFYPTFTWLFVCMLVSAFYEDTKNFFYLNKLYLNKN